MSGTVEPSGEGSTIFPFCRTESGGWQMSGRSGSQDRAWPPTIATSVLCFNHKPAHAILFLLSYLAQSSSFTKGKKWELERTHDRPWVEPLGPPMFQRTLNMSWLAGFHVSLPCLVWIPLPIGAPPPSTPVQAACQCLSHQVQVMHVAAAPGLPVGTSAPSWLP